jgi:hypothetical protein
MSSRDRTIRGTHPTKIEKKRRKKEATTTYYFPVESRRVATTTITIYTPIVLYILLSSDLVPSYI